MKLAIMQPYFFPYIGYFQLINAVDTFVIYDDVNFIKQGWINRNFILINDKKHFITLELKGASSSKLINQIQIGSNRNRLMKTVFQSYAKAPFFKNVFPIVEDSINYRENNLARYVLNSLQNIARYLDIGTKFLISSSIQKDNDLKGEKKVLHICKLLKVTEYINAIGGKELYSKEEFKKNNIDIYFVDSNEIIYKQFNDEFVPNLSIIDVLMFNEKEKVKGFLQDNELI
jgi:hypothetical protein